MAWKDGFVIEYVDNGSGKISCYKCIHFNRDDKSCARTGVYVPDVGRKHWLTCRAFDLADDYNTIEMREKADLLRARAQNRAKSQKHNAAKQAATNKKEWPAASARMVKGPHIGRAIHDRQHRAGALKPLTRTTAANEFENNSTKQFRVPEALSGSTINTQNRRNRFNKESRGEHKEHQPQREEPPLDAGSLLNRLVQSPKYGRGIVVESHGSIITVVFAKGLLRVKFDAITAARKQSLQFGPVVKKPTVRQEAVAKENSASREAPEILTPNKDTAKNYKPVAAPKPSARKQASKNRRHKAVDRHSAQGSKAQGSKAQGSKAQATIADVLDNETLAKLEDLKLRLKTKRPDEG